MAEGKLLESGSTIKGNQYLIDMECLRGCRNQLLIKEMAILDMTTLQFESFTFAPPHKWQLLPKRVQITNRWITVNQHKIPWTDGLIPYKELYSILRKYVGKCARVFVKGSEKCTLLSNLLKLENCTFTNLDDIGCPKFTSLLKLPTHYCFLHQPYQSHCASAKCFTFFLWLKGHRP